MRQSGHGALHADVGTSGHLDDFRRLEKLVDGNILHRGRYDRALLAQQRYTEVMRSCKDCGHCGRPGPNRHASLYTDCREVGRLQGGESIREQTATCEAHDPASAVARRGQRGEASPHRRTCGAQPPHSPSTNTHCVRRSARRHACQDSSSSQGHLSAAADSLGQASCTGTPRLRRGSPRGTQHDHRS
jgi:hypothetical protein